MRSTRFRGLETLLLVPIAVEDPRIITALSDELKDELQLREVRVGEPMATPQESFDKYRKQYKSGYLLNALDEKFWSTQAGRVLGVTSLDIFTDGTNFIFGEARCPGKVAVVSTRRLNAGSEQDGGGPGLLLERLLKTAVHELGHTLGLLHCPRYECVMFFSTNVSETDRKSATPCGSCEGKLTP